jgi:hypothetical protein
MGTLIIFYLFANGGVVVLVYTSYIVLDTKNYIIHLLRLSNALQP